MSKASLKEWKSYYENLGLHQGIYSSYLEYTKKFIDNDLPPIFEFVHLAQTLGRTPHYLATVINSPQSHYREFTIKKRSGGLRTISAPYPALLECQRWINKEILSKIPVNKSAHGFVVKKSIRSNALVHLGANALLKIDIQDFFPSIKINRVIGIFNDLGYAPNVSFYLAAVCCVDESLPQGAATSPAISNIVCRKLDSRLTSLSKKWDLIYTRYADDMTFSGAMITANFMNIVKKIIQEEGFSLREDKTRLINANKKIVTGISISGDKLTLPKKFKRDVRQQAHHIIKYGYISHVSKLKIKDPYYLDRIHGRLVFWKWIEPEAKFPNIALPQIREIMNNYKPRLNG